MGRRRSSAVNKLFVWVRQQSTKVKACLALTTVISLLIALKYLVKQLHYFFVASEAIHAVGIAVLVYKLSTKRNCSGLSLKMQELTAIFMAVRLYCSFIFEGDVHTFLDFAALASTAWVIYMMKIKLKSTYVSELDTMPLYYIVVPSFILAIVVHPHSDYLVINSILWAFGTYLETVSVLPQLLMVQNTKFIEPFTAHYVFALGIARFLGCAHWIIQVYETKGAFLFMVGGGYFWITVCFLAEIVQTSILADFCYYYVKSVVNGQTIAYLPV